MSNRTRDILKGVRQGTVSVDEALLALREEPFEDLGYAKVDLHRQMRQGASEVIYGEGKTAEQIVGILRALAEAGQDRVLVTRLDADKAAEVERGLLAAPDASTATDSSALLDLHFSYHPEARLGMLGEMPESSGIGTVVVACAGTSDLPVAEEAALTAEFYGNKVDRLYDVGVAGLHRLLAHTDEVMAASVVIAVAGMEGALASVIGGLVSCPVIAVPTSVGYGASFQGLSALLAMLNSCASGVAVVNIDNGFGAGFLASRINHMGL